MLAKLKRIDLPIVVILLVFMVASKLLVYSGMVSDPQINIELWKIFMIDAIALIVFAFFSLVDYRLLLKLAPYLYGVTLVLLVVVWQFGEKTKGAAGWFYLPFSLSFQPAELAKIVLIMTLAVYMARRNGEKLGLVKDVLPLGMITLIPFVLVMLQPDLGNAIIYVAILLGLYWIGNIRYLYVLAGVGLAGGGLYTFKYFMQNFQEETHAFFEGLGVPDHWMRRMDTFFNPELADANAKWQVENAVRAIGSGGLTGEGYLQGTSLHNNFIPYAYTDSIFVVVGEEFGFVGSSILLLLYFILIYRMILIAISSTTTSGSYIVIGVVSMFVFQIFENIGMMLGIMPLTGITLPFISYGGTSLIINMLAMGMVMSIKLYNDHTMDNV